MSGRISGLLTDYWFKISGILPSIRWISGIFDILSENKKKLSINSATDRKRKRCRKEKESSDASAPGALHVVVVVYHVTIVAIGHGLLKKFWPFWYKAAFYALQGIQLFETMQTRLLH